MSKKVTCTIEPFKGSVTFFEPLNIEQVFAIEDAQDNIVDMPDSKFLLKVQEVAGEEKQSVTWNSRADKQFLPAICLCVEKWEIEGLPEKVTPETFPMTPRGASHQLVDWLYNELMKIYSGDTSVPNAS